MVAHLLQQSLSHLLFRRGMRCLPNFFGQVARFRVLIVQGSDLRPPLGIEVTIQGKRILVVRME
jgi:hypothetical protein